MDPPDNPDWRTTLQAFGVWPKVVPAGATVPVLPHGARDATAAVVYTLDSTDCLSNDVLTRFRWGDLPVSYDFRWLADATPVKGCDADGQPLIAEFSDLAGASDGVDWLGVLRMDVDNLGNVFKQGLGNDATVSRMSTLSESLRLFFEAWVPRLCRGYNEQVGQHRLYLLYAGGDDLFIVGAWSALPELARKICADFHEFVGGHHITLSGGIAIEHQKFPLYQLAESARHALDEQAKAFTRPNGGHLKDALCFLQTPMGWERFDEVAAWQEKLLTMLKPDGEIPALPRGFLAWLMEIHALYDDNRKRKKKLSRGKEMTRDQIQEMIHYDRWQWRLVYQLSRFGERYKEHQNTINQLGQAIMREGGLITDLRVVARWVALLTREE
jgi:CRISPR-associated protein Csm1